MANRATSATVWLIASGIGLLFLARGAFQPYIFPLFENLGGFSYAGIATLLNAYVFAQFVGAPMAGWYTDRMPVRVALSTSILLGCGSFLFLSSKPGYAGSAIAVFMAGIAFVLAKISLNTILVVHSSPEDLRRSVAKRATLLNLGSFFGNSLAVTVAARAGYQAHAVMLGLLYLPLAIGLVAAPMVARTKKEHLGFGQAMVFLRNQAFVADSIRRFAQVLPYGCWGTIIPKYVYDQYHSKDPIWIVSLTSVATTVVGAHFLAVHLAGKLQRRGFKWEWWSLTTVLLFCSGLLLLGFAKSPVMLPAAIVVFICGEVLMTPCFDEAAKKHSGSGSMGTCMGLLHLVDGCGRWLGAVFSLALYGWMRNSSLEGYYWPATVSVFLLAAVGLHFVAEAIDQKRSEDGEGWPSIES